MADRHRYICTCPDYEHRHDIACKHTHLVGHMDGRLWLAEAFPLRKRGGNFDAVKAKFGPLGGGQMKHRHDMPMPELAEWWSSGNGVGGNGQEINRQHRPADCTRRGIGHGQCHGRMPITGQEYNYGQRIRSKSAILQYQKSLAALEDVEKAERQRQKTGECSYGYTISFGGARAAIAEEAEVTQQWHKHMKDMRIQEYQVPEQQEPRQVGKRRHEMIETSDEVPHRELVEPRQVGKRRREMIEMCDEVPHRELVEPRQVGKRRREIGGQVQRKRQRYQGAHQEIGDDVADDDVQVIFEGDAEDRVEIVEPVHVVRLMDERQMRELDLLYIDHENGDGDGDDDKENIDPLF